MRCSHHPDVVSAACSTCTRPFCPTCSQSATLCRECTYAEAASQAHARALEFSTPHAEHQPLQWRLPAALVLLGVLLIVFLSGPPLLPRRVHGVGGAPPHRPTAGYQRCVQQMWQLRAALRTYALEHGGAPPAALQDLPEELGRTTCPALGHTYGYAVRPEAEVDAGEQPPFYLCCPDPGLHGVQAIECGPESLAPVVTR